ncbi:hypothetical protein MVES1_003471 [Malassezia vespertilionis]|uniref:THIF-type NAD/FAD binding fold domain-containing protein n=1 Tax=Malassezia vespertilionis TaxID=2020962 RepID=A0A2N1J751_9BASI|nr:uncharacterized protein MVES1_003471 [Malassezia vespertilionis]PKI82388.1 hypothetical protein MVES_003712 [Malassezia vespertilionis]WFD08102.1 hypothetical protein MVES1_003471 [Malassezia vespertilionis]
MHDLARGSASGRGAWMLGAVAVGSSLATLLAVLSYQRSSRKARRKRLETEAHKAAVASALPSLHGGGIGTAHTPPTEAHDETLIREQLSRNYSFLGEEGMQRVRDSFVIVVGAGGVGSWSALMLLRSGVGHIRIIDFDQVSLSSLNRHACATLADVGRPKVECCAHYFEQVAPWANVEACAELFHAKNAARLLDGQPTYVVDAIDNLETKVALLRFCATHHLRVFSSMGAGAKADPSRIQISDISTTVEDPLARVVRRELRAVGVPPIPAVHTQHDPPYTDADFAQEWCVPCVYSTEKSDVRLLPLPEDEMDKGDVGELAAFEDFRVRILPVLGPLPAMFGLAAATYILCDLAGHKMEPLNVKGRRKLYEKLFADLNVTESRYPSPHTPAPPPANRTPLTASDIPPTYHASHPSSKNGPPPKVRIPFSVNDCAYLFEEVFRGRSVVPPFETLGTGQLMRWDPKRPLEYTNVALFTRKQAREHETVLKESLDPEAFWGAHVAEMMRRRLAEERRMSHWR